MTRTSAVAGLAVAVLMATACSGGGEAKPSNTGLSDDVPDETVDPTSDDAAEESTSEAVGTTGATDGVVVDLPPLAVPVPEPDTLSVLTDDGEQSDEQVLPTDLLAAVQRGVDAGSFSLAEGIARALDGISGRAAPTPGLAADDVLDPGLTGLTRTGTDLLRGGDLESAEAALLEASLAFFTPTQAVLDRISRPAPGSGVSSFASIGFGRATRSSASGRPSAVDPACSDVDSMGFTSSLDSGDQCYLYQEITIEGRRLRVYYPTSWQTDADRQTWISEAFDGLATSVVVYSEFDVTIGDINAVFSLAGSGTARAAQSYFGENEACPITIYPAGTGRGDGRLQQTLAHETFHCIQDWTYTTSPYSTHKWWLEGSATYFSNVVYPALNDEHQWTDSFDRESRTLDPTEMSYGNTVFFQYYANVKGVDSVLDLLDTVSSGGATLTTLSSIDGMAEIWQDFVVVFVVDAIFDPGGGTVGRGKRVNDSISVDRVQTINYNAFPMRTNRFLVEYEKGKHFEQSTNEATAYAVVEAPRRADINAWTKMPLDVRPTCEDNKKYVVVPTTVDQPRTLVTEVATADQAVCDPCLLGTWSMQLSSFADYIVTLLEVNGAAIPNMVLQIDGNYDFTFTANGELRTERNLSVKPIVGGLGAPTTVVTGSENGTYDADGGKLTVSNVSGAADAAIGGVSASVFNGPDGGMTDYTCDADVLTMTTLPYGPLVFDFIDPPPEPPPVIIQTGG